MLPKSKNKSKDFLPTPDQERALGEIMTWTSEAFQGKGAPYLTLGGYAGTGKTTLIAHLRNLLAEKKPELKVAFCAFTGKASQVLHGKLKDLDALGGEDSVSTIHALIYEAIVDDDGRLIEWRKRKRVPAGLIILDEASMVGQGIFTDLLSHGVPILAVGDHGQLPPINDSFSLMSQPDIRLEEIHRQAQDSPIIRLSMDVRERGRIPFGSFGQGVSKIRAHDLDLEGWVSSQSSDTLVLAGRNATRIHLNRKIRGLLGFEGDEPQLRDRVICLRNNWEKRIFNGQLGSIEGIGSGPEREGERHWWKLEVAFDDGAIYSGLASRHQFLQPKTLMEVPGLRASEMGELFDYGYALTVHKAQGSQAKRVLVFEERILREESDWRRWLYTAVTRAETELTVVAN